MRIFSFFFLVVSLIANADDLTPTVRSWPLNEAFIAVGFDTNDRITALVTGTLGNTCYKVAGYEAKFDDATKTYFIKQNVYEYSGAGRVCMQVTVPFTQVVELGLIARKGDYTLADGATGKVLTTFPIKQATNPAEDDFTYAPVSSARVNRGEEKHEVELKGFFTDSCLKIKDIPKEGEESEKDIRVDYQGKVLVVQPIVTREGADCKTGKFRFTAIKKFKADITTPFLLHVRSMNGNAINDLIDW